MRQAGRAETLVAKTARELARLSLNTDEGEFLGAEDDLLDRLGVSRPTLRQAAKIVESDRLVSVRRGVKGGFYATRPDAADAIRTLVRYLRMRGGTLGDILVVSRLVSEEAAARACHCEDQVMRQRLKDFLSSVDENDSPSAMIKAESALGEIISKMSGNPAIELVMAIGFTFGREEREVGLYRAPEHREMARGMHRQLCMAILDRDEEIARLIMRRRSATMMKWLDTQSGAGT